MSAITQAPINHVQFQQQIGTHVSEKYLDQSSHEHRIEERGNARPANTTVSLQDPVATNLFV